MYEHPLVFLICTFFWQTLKPAMGQGVVFTRFSGKRLGVKRRAGLTVRAGKCRGLLLGQLVRLGGIKGAMQV